MTHPKRGLTLEIAKIPLSGGIRYNPRGFHPLAIEIGQWPVSVDDGNVVFGNDLFSLIFVAIQDLCKLPPEKRHSQAQRLLKEGIRGLC